MKPKTKSTSRARKAPNMGDIAYAKPLPGRRVRDPKTMQLLPAKGVRVRVDQHWLRRVKDGDVALSFEPATIKPETPVTVDMFEAPEKPEKGNK